MERLPGPSAGLLTDGSKQGHLRLWCSDAQGQWRQLGRGSPAPTAATARGGDGQPGLGGAGGGGRQPDRRH